MTYDQWKTRDPADLYDYDPRDCEHCLHPYWQTRYAFFTGRATCLGCGERIPWCEPAPFVERVRDRWTDLRHWLRWDVWWAIKRPFRAVRSWWRGHRRAPWRPDDDLPF